MRYWCNDAPVELNVQGRPVRGGEERLICLSNNLLHGLSIDESGYGVFPFLAEGEFLLLKSGIENMLRRALQLAGVQLDEGFSPENYHVVCSDGQHASVLELLRSWAAIGNFPVDTRLVDGRVSDICSTRVALDVAGVPASGYFFIRIVRPKRFLDNNPPHRDSWLDRLKGCVNCYVPLWGSNSLSSLPVMPGSHYWPECYLERTDGGAIVDGIRYSVPGIMRSVIPLRMVRPHVGHNQIMLFSPHLVHGGALNLNEDVTRVSLEMRLWPCS